MITSSIPYPVELRGSNFLIVMITITVLGFLAAKVASSRISADFIDK
jgi:lipoprotein-releasing system permease protein